MTREQSDKENPEQPISRESQEDLSKDANAEPVEQHLERPRRRPRPRQVNDSSKRPPTR